MRQYVRHVIMLPAATNMYAGIAYYDDEDFVFRDRASLHDTVAATAMDLGKWTMQDGNGYSRIQARLDAYNNDTAIFNSASMPSQDKNFSHFAVLVMADYQHAGIWRDKISQMDKVTHQLTAVNRDVGKNSEVNNGTRCNRRPFEDCPVGLTKQLPSTEMGKEVKEQSFGCGIGAPHGWVGGTECRDWA